MVVDVRALVIEYLRNPSICGIQRQELRADYIARDLAVVLRDRKLEIQPGMNAWYETHGHLEPHGNLFIPVSDVVWDLIIEGILRPGSGTNSDVVFPHIHVTPYGREVFREPGTPHDPDNYLKEIKALRPDLDVIIMTYLTESVHSLQRGLTLASTITLGCACEKAFLLVIDGLSIALNATDRVQFDSDIAKDWKIKAQHRVFMNWFTKSVLPKMKAVKTSPTWISELQSSLLFVFDNFRNARNDAGHPSGTPFSKNQVHSYHVMFRSYIVLLYELMDWMKTNPL